MKFVIKSILSFCCSFLLTTGLFSQTKNKNTLIIKLKEGKEDTLKVKTLILISRAYVDSMPDSAFLYASQAFLLSQKIKFKKGLCEAALAKAIACSNKSNFREAIDLLNNALENCYSESVRATIFGNLGLCYHDMGDYVQALNYYEQSYELNKKLDNKTAQGRNLCNMGIVYYDQGDYPKALNYYFSALKIDELLSDKSTIAMDLSNIGIVYHDLEDFSKALEYYNRSLLICRELGNKRDIAKAVGNIAILFDDHGEYKKAIEYYSEAIKLNELIGNKRSLAINLSNAGGLYVELGKQAKMKCSCTNDSGYFKLANECYQKALTINQEIGNKRSVGINKGNMGELKMYTNKPKEAEILILDALRISRSLGELAYAKIWLEALTELYESQKNYSKAFESYVQYIAVRDSISNEENIKKQTELEMQYEFDKKEAATKAKQDKKDAITQAEKTKQQIVIALVSFVLLLVVVFAIIVLRSLSITKRQKIVIEKQKKQVEHQKHLVEEKQKEIIDSINYARRIQMSILPNEKYVERNLNKQER